MEREKEASLMCAWLSTEARDDGAGPFFHLLSVKVPETGEACRARLKAAHSTRSYWASNLSGL